MKITAKGKMAFIKLEDRNTGKTPGTMIYDIGNCCLSFLFLSEFLFEINQSSVYILRFYLMTATVVQKPEVEFVVNLFLQENCLPKLQFHSILEAWWKQLQTPAGIS